MLLMPMVGSGGWNPDHLRDVDASPLRQNDGVANWYWDGRQFSSCDNLFVSIPLHCPPFCVPCKDYLALCRSL